MSGRSGPDWGWFFIIIFTVAALGGGGGLKGCDNTGTDGGTKDGTNVCNEYFRGGC